VTGSPLLALRLLYPAIQRWHVPWRAILCEQNKQSAAQLRAAIAAEPYGDHAGITVLRGRWQHTLLARLAEDRWPAFSCVLTLCDHNGFAPVLDLVRLFRHPAMRYVDLLLVYNAEHPRRCRGVNWRNPHPDVQRMTPKHLPDIRSTMKLIGKAHWQFRLIPNDDDRSPKRVILLATNHPNMRVDRAGGFVPETDAKAEDLYNRIDLKKAAYRQLSMEGTGDGEHAETR
jgi:hypothetical protein